MIRVELYDLARRRAGTAELRLDAATLGDALGQLGARWPELADLTHFRVSLNGERFVEDPATPLADGDSLLVLSAQSGG